MNPILNLITIRKYLWIVFVMCFSTINAQNVSFDWLKSLGGPNNDVLRGVCIDSSGNIYATGSFSGTTSIANQNLVSNGATDIIVIKFDSSGSLLWSKSLGSVSFDYAFDIDCEPNGNFYITGGFRQTLNFSPSISLTSSGEMDLFTAKFDTYGNCIWAKSATGYSSEYGNEIATTANGNVAVIGNTQGTIVFTADTLFHMDSTDLFLVKYDSNGNEMWSKGLPGLGNAGGRAISTDDFENTIIAGSFAGNIYIDTVIFNSTTVPNNDIYISKFSPTGTLIWAKQFGGTGDDYARGIDADANDNIYVSGVFSNSVNFDGITLTANGSSDIFLMKLDSNGNIIWIKQIGNLGAEEGCEIEALPTGDIFITGGFSQTIILGSNNFTALGMRDVFIAKIDSSGNIIWAKTAGSAMDDVNYAIGLNMYNEDVCTVGTYSGSFTDGLNSITSLGGVDSYISKIKSSLTTSINDIINSSTTIAIYPNPSNTIINVECKKGFEIYNSTGQLVKQSSQATTQINISDLPTGIYFLKTDHQFGRFIKTE